jgi:hypothetical protein
VVGNEGRSQRPRGPRPPRLHREAPRLLADPVGALIRTKRTVRDDLAHAGNRGSSAHDALEKLVADGVIPDPDTYPEDERGYIEGLLAWHRDANPEIEDAEVLVGSKSKGYAGRYDLRVRQEEVTLIVRADTGQTAVFPAGSYLVDAKTSKDVYEAHVLQLDLYEDARVECGYTPTDGQYVLRLDAAGTYEAVRVLDDQRGLGKDILPAYHALKAAKPYKPRKPRGRAA